MWFVVNLEFFVYLFFNELNCDLYIVWCYVCGVDRVLFRKSWGYIYLVKIKMLKCGKIRD